MSFQQLGPSDVAHHSNSGSLHTYTRTFGCSKKEDIGPTTISSSITDLFQETFFYLHTTGHIQRTRKNTNQGRMCIVFFTTPFPVVEQRRRDPLYSSIMSCIIYTPSKL